MKNKLNIKSKKGEYILSLFIFAILLLIVSVSADTIFSDDFEDGDLAGWTLTAVSGGNNWTNSNTDPFEGTRHAQSQPQSTSEPASVIERIVSTSGYKNTTFSYYRKLIGLDGADEFQVEYNTGSGWTVLENTNSTSQDDASYVFKNFSLPGSADNNSNFQIKFECTAGGVTEFCRVDNVTIKGNVISTLPDTTSPNVTINQPLNQTYTTTTINFNVTALDETGMNSCLYTLNSGIKNYTMTNLTSSPTQWNATNSSMSQGSHTVRYYCKDTSNNLNNSESVTFFIDTINPQVTINSPLSKNYSQLNANFTLNEAGYCKYSLNAGINNYTMTVNSSNTGFNHTNSSIANGIYTLTAYCNDTIGNNNYTEIVSFQIDATNPLIDYGAGTPQSNTNQSSISIFVNVTVIETNEDTIVFRVHNSTNEYNVSSFTDRRRTINFTGLSDGTYRFNATINDSAGNINTTATRTLIIDNQPPSVTSLTETPSDPSIYSLNAIYKFNATITDTVPISSVFLEFNGINYTTSKNGNVYNATLRDLPAGTFNYRWFANDSLGNVNNSQTGTYTVNQAGGEVNLYVNGTRANFSTSNGTANQNIWLNASLINGTGNIEIWVNGALYNNGTSPLSNLSNLSIGFYNISAFYRGNTNFTSDSEAWWINITDIIAPTITINSPANQTYTTANIDLNVSANEIINTWWYTNNSGINNKNFTPNLSSIKWEQGSNILTVYANDSSGNKGNNTVTFFIDSINPNIQYQNPTETNGSFINHNSIEINITASDTNLGNIIIRIYNSSHNQINSSLTSSSPNFINFSVLSDGLFYFNATANDTLNNLNNTLTRTVTIDTTNPLIDYSIGTSTDNSYQSNTNIFINITVTETNEANITFRLFYSNGTLFNSTTFTDKTRAINFTSLSDNTYKFNVTVFDVVSKSNTTYTRNVTIDSINPSIVITTPSNNTNTTNTGIDVNYTVSDNNLVSCWYSNDSMTVNNSITCGTNITNITWSEGQHNLTIYANDSAGNKAFASITFIIDTTPPLITINLPISKNHSTSTITFNITTNEPAIAWFTIDNGITNYTMTNNGNRDFNYTLTGIADGDYTARFYANDTLSHLNNSETIVFGIDTVFPSLTLTEPNGTKLSRTNIPLNFSASDSKLDSCLFNIYQGASIHKSNNSINCSEQTIFNVDAVGSFTINFYINDSAGNVNSTSNSFSVSTGSSPPPSNGGGGSSSGGGGGGGSLVTGIKAEGKIEMSDISDIISQPGDKKTLSLIVKNIGKSFLNNCKLLAIGDIKSWFYNEQINGIAPGENANFIFNLNVPEEIEEKDYFGKLIVICDEKNQSQEIIVTVLKRLGSIIIDEIKQENKDLNISYFYNGTVGENVAIEIWIENDEGLEIKRITDSFIIENELTKRNILMELPDNLIGIYYIHFALSTDLDNFIRQSIVLGKPVTTGFGVFNEFNRKIVGYLTFVIIILIGIFFIIKKYIFGKEENQSKKNKKNLKSLRKYTRIPQDYKKKNKHKGI